jgi:probable HAF family extracellular repeat protein
MFTSHITPAIATPRIAALALTLLLAACGGGGGGGGGYTPAPPSTPGPVTDSGPTYDVIPLGLPDVYGDIGRHGIANGGIVAGTSWGGPGGNARAFLYNGSTSVDLGTLGGTFARALAVNACGHVAGWSDRADGSVGAFYYDGALHDLGTLGGTASFGNAINACGKIAGWSTTVSGQSHAFYFDGATLRDLGSFGGDSFALVSNTPGQVVGYSYGPGNAWYHAFLYDSRTGGPLQDLGTPGVNSLAQEINDAGQVVGYTRTGDGPLRAFLYEKGMLRDIGTLGGASAEAVSINAAGIAIGHSNLADGAQRGFVYDGTTMTSIGALAGSNYSDAVAINASRLVVGSSTAGAGGDEHAISWSAKDGIVDLNTRLHDAPAGLVLVTGLAVADDGNIAVRTNHGLALLKLRH